MLDALQDFTNSLPDAIAVLGVMLISAIPFVESYFGAAIGVLAGIWPPLAIVAAIIGNAVSMFIFVQVAHRVRSRVAKDPQQRSNRRQKLRNAFDKYGVAGVSLLGQTILPSQITSAALISFGAPRNTVLLWQVISITLWGIAFGVLAALGVAVLR